MRIRLIVVTDGDRWIAHGESDASDSESLCHMEVECSPQWQTNLNKDMVCAVEVDIPYQPNRLQAVKGSIVPVDAAIPPS